MMKLNTDRLNAFYQVAVDKSFSKAADTLCITQSALTEQGKTLLEYASDLQAREQDVLNSISGRSAIANGIVRIGAFSSVMRSVVMP